MHVRAPCSDNNRSRRSFSTRVHPLQIKEYTGNKSSLKTNKGENVSNVWSAIALQQHWANQIKMTSNQASHSNNIIDNNSNDNNDNNSNNNNNNNIYQSRVSVTDDRAPRAVPLSRHVPLQRRQPFGLVREPFSLKYLETNKRGITSAEEMITAPGHSHTGHHTSMKAKDAAVKLGLIELPTPPKDADWDRVVAVHQARLSLPCSTGATVYSSHYGDKDIQTQHAVTGACAGAYSSKEYTCSICLESFIATSHTEPQVILDCTHVFHSACLSQLEKYLRRAKEKLACPLCRKEKYYKRALIEGPKQLQYIAAVKIQTRIRGVLARKLVTKLMIRSDPKFAAEYALSQLKEISDLYLSRAVAREKEVDEIIERMDLERQIAVAGMMSDDDWAAIRNKILTRSSDCCNNGDSDTHHIDHNICGETVTEEGVECLICLGVLIDSVSGRCVDNAVMLSCSHFFHEPCLKTFERLTVRESSMAPSSHGDIGQITCHQKPLRCPVCRSGYATRPLL